MISELKSKKRIAVLFIFALVTALLLSACANKKTAPGKFSTLSDLEGCTFALSDGNSSYEIQIESDIPGVKFERYTNYFDTFVAVANGNADAAFCFKYTFIGLKESYPGLKYIETEYKIPIVANFSKGSGELKKDFNKFISEARESGLLDRLAEKWLYGYDELTDDDTVDFDDLKQNEKTFKFAISDENIPYEYLKNGKLTGYEPALFHEFCKSHGYKPEIIVSTYDSILAGISTGKFDMAMGAYGYTDERDETSNFSDPYFDDLVVYTVNGGSDSAGFLNDMKDGFERTFIRQNRWKLFVHGILITLLITLLSVISGSAVGFALFMLSRRRKWLSKLSAGIHDTLEALPLLVVLMVFFYVIFGRSSISGVIVSVIVFGLNFAFTFYALMSGSVRGVPPEQTEAGIALGYSRSQTLFRIVLPQAMESFLPSIRSAIVATLKGTAVVGYVAVEDLTKAGDLVRSQTFETFFPILSVAVLYFLLAKLLIFLLSKLLVTPAERRRMKKEGKA